MTKQAVSVGFVGLGNMGRGMASSLVRAGIDLTVFDVNQSAMTLLQDQGASTAASLTELAQTMDVIFLSLPGPTQVEQVMLGGEGVVASMQRGLVVFDTSTSSIALGKRIDIAMSEHDGAFLDAPVSGQPAGAASGELAIWIGGDHGVFESYRELLSALGKPSHLGDVGSGTVAKLAHNMTGYMVLHALAEAFSLGVKAGIEPLTLWSALKTGVLGRTTPLDMLTKQFLPAAFDPAAFALELSRKDVRLATELGTELGVPLPMANLTLQEMSEGVARGWGGLDARSFLTLQLERAGVEIRVPPEDVEAARSAASH